ncbi:MAG: hypothetical protein GX589_10000, partial [Deltaproteobacteria bacterium]|nr:hypothetical protein [Deltaproteobacteria bacterium]
DPNRWEEGECGGVVAARLIHYRGSSFGSAGIASDKQPLFSGSTATFDNYTSYSRGINSVLVDITGLPEGSAISASDFKFKVGNSNNLETWTTAPAPSSVTVVPGAGVDGSARVEIVWADGAIQKQWLRIEVLANANTGLQDSDVFYFGNAIGETGNSATDAIVNATDQVLARANSSSFRQVEVTNRYDFNKDGLVNITDVLVSRANPSGFTPLKLITAP